MRNFDRFNGQKSLLAGMQQTPDVLEFPIAERANDGRPTFSSQGADVFIRDLLSGRAGHVAREVKEARAISPVSKAIQGDQSLPASPIHANPLSGGKKDPSLGSAIAVNLADMVDIDNRGPVQPHELVGVQLGIKGFYAFPQQVFLSPRVQARVIVCCFDPLDVAYRHN